MSGRFITLEGGEGAGKSSNIGFLRGLISESGHRVVTTREPGGTPLAEDIRALLLAERSEPMPDMTELLLMFAARSAHLAQKIKPALADGTWVVCDRFTDASYVYQGAARGMGNEPVALLENLVQERLRPDRVLLFDLPVEVGLERAGKRGAGNRFDHEKVTFHEQVRAAYLARAAEHPGRYSVINAGVEPAQVQAQIRSALADWL